MAEKGYGDFAVRANLLNLKIPEDLADHAVSVVSREISEEKRLSVLMNKKKGQTREKVIRFLAGRGFGYESILDALGGEDQ